MKAKLLILTMCLLSVATAKAQDWMIVHRTYKGVDWTYPIRTNEVGEMRFSADGRTFQVSAPSINGEDMIIPFSAEYLDSISFANDLTDDEKGHNKYRVFTMYIDTECDPSFINKEEWTDCRIAIDGKGEYSNLNLTAQIKGRGNSTWLWYDKKPYKIKLCDKSKILGLEKAKNWNLLANWRDVTDMMNVFAFETARYMGMPFTNHTRFVEVFLNGEYNGTYQLTEKIEIGKNRVNIDKDGGVLLSFDLDDGPSLSPYATDNFWSKVFSLPISVKEPEDLSTVQLDSIREEFAILEKAIKMHNYQAVDSLMDIPSFISILQLHEYLFNVEIDAPRSVYAFRDKGGKWTFGPVWDWDAGFDFSWSDMYTGHNFFGNPYRLIYGSEPYTGKSASYSINKFWREMFDNSTFVAQYKQAWAEKTDSIFIHPWAETKHYIDEMKNGGTYDRDIERWPLPNTRAMGISVYYSPDEEVSKMESWLKDRLAYLNDVIFSYPVGNNEIAESTDPVVSVKDDGIHVSVICSFAGGYQQTGRIEIDPEVVKQRLGGTPQRLIPLNANGKEGNNTAAGVYGAWFDAGGSTVNWGDRSHVYIESNELYSWAYGCHPESCGSSHQHSVTMQYVRGSKKLNVTVDFTIKK